MAFIKIRPGEVKDGVFAVGDDTVYMDADHVRYVRPTEGGATLIHTAWSEDFLVKGSPASVVAGITQARQDAHHGKHEPCECPQPAKPTDTNEPPKD